jgi:hypothetical protein
MKKSLVLIVLVLGFLPAKAFADGITCTVTGTNAVTIMESANESDEEGTQHCPSLEVSFPSAGEGSVVLNILENPAAPGFDSKNPVSDYMEITPGGDINLLSDSDEKGLPDRGGPSSGIVDVGPEPLDFGPVVFTAGGTTYTVFSDVTPEPSTIFLFGSGLLALYARRKKQ